MFSLPIFIVPWSGSPDASATVRAPVASIDTFAEIEVDAVSNNEALVKIIEVAAFVIAPFNVVSEKGYAKPEKVPAPKPMPSEAVTKPMFS